MCTYDNKVMRYDFWKAVLTYMQHSVEECFPLNLDSWYWVGFDLKATRQESNLGS